MVWVVNGLSCRVESVVVSQMLVFTDGDDIAMYRPRTVRWRRLAVTCSDVGGNGDGVELSPPLLLILPPPSSQPPLSTRTK